MSTLSDVMAKWKSDPNFKEEFRKNPKKALEEAALELNATDLAKMKSMLKNEDEKLDPRINQ